MAAVREGVWRGNLERTEMIVLVLRGGIVSGV